MTFVGGPCTHGPGAIVSKELSKTMRSHNDLLKGLAPMFKDASKHYEALADRCVRNSHVVDIFACSRTSRSPGNETLCRENGGLTVLADSFGQSVFKESFQRVFKRHPDTAQNAIEGT